MFGDVKLADNSWLLPEAMPLKTSLTKIIMYGILLFWMLTTIYPVFWVINNSFKPSEDVISNSFALTESFDLLNYKTAAQKMNVLESYINSLVISGSVVILAMIFAGFAAYVIARYKFPLKSVINTALAGSMLFPVFSTIIPVFTILYRLHLTSGYAGLILPQTAENLPFAVLILSACMSAIPSALEEAAYMDGCNTWQRFTRIIVPISKPSFATAAIFTFFQSYNDLFMPLVLLRKKEAYPVCLLLNEIGSRYRTDFGLMAAAITMTVIPVMIIYLLAQSRLIKGLTASVIKE